MPSSRSGSIFHVALLAVAACGAPGPGDAVAPGQASGPPPVAVTPVTTAAPVAPRSANQALAVSRAAARPGSAGPIEVAVTVDDLPAHGPVPAGVTRLAIHQEFLKVFRAHAVPQVYGFLNAAKLAEHPEDRAALEAWVAAGHPLGNHTYSHPHLEQIGLDAYLGEIDRNEPLLRALMGKADERTWKVFRYPFLKEGHDLPSRNAIRAHLAGHGYRIAQVTIDFADWAWNEPYTRCMERRDEEAIKVLERAFVNYGRASLQWSDATARQTYGRPIKHVLLLHVGAFDARAMDRLLTAYEKEGVRWVSLDEALSDPVYATDTGFTATWGQSMLEQMTEAHAAPHPPYIPLPTGFLRVLCRPEYSGAVPGASAP
ncbi:polysaccharide deacetylase family protein [Chondromyces apiculatus]|uniref:Polysaccharide deacetylase n=1 Tax=Chondromyces apiculatus DSM 436 TaxID=1192034 RepID=A0A017T1T7_9BACT|nr:polysaccharide deacetylase family protein [Chondromyces apiculatus]EYF02501.1 polysaccharide deacetylase [Chondromyces apiculatus DSM 436]